MRYYKIKNLVFEGGGILGIAYLGVLDFLYHKNILQNIRRVAGTSAGAIIACITSFALPFNETKEIIDTLDYSKIPQKNDHPALKEIPIPFRKNFEEIFENIDCLYRLVNDYGWYSSEYFYEWIKKQIASQFDASKKLPPYTFEDFKNTSTHKDQKPFLDLYIIGTDISTKSSKLFSYETTPHMEVAQAVRISMSIPLFFESVKVNPKTQTKKSMPHIYSDGGIMRNYPIKIFDSSYFKDRIVNGINIQTLGVRFKNATKYNKINNFIEYIENLLISFISIQQDIYNHSPEDQIRSIQIDTKDISFIDFNIHQNDEKYRFLYQEGYKAAKNYFQKKAFFPRGYL
ncbi:patatin-like phospholipase family protein [Crassaminicella indica]|uniref:Patatin-like phospholipase family protein n=1 Tax=Crassaminicella indica TaxID=2855394 RepID=A0ABX8RB35_9CLOT|nr:patatin-like phospholipase family protein [Crassaminicella indica]QXM06270.1 patatin-like phospholipase family protein [Crassaminicella indica]